jgi:hypothetical protein
MKTAADLARVKAQLDAHFEESYGSKARPKTIDLAKPSGAYVQEHDAFMELLFEARDPGWKEAGLEGAIAAVWAKYQERVEKMNSCPACGLQGGTVPCIDTLSFLERVREAVKRRAWALNPLNSPGQVAVLLGRMGRELMGDLKGERFEMTLLLICQRCKRYSTQCPYCSQPKLLAGKNECDHETVTCDNCERKFALCLLRE